MRESNLFFAYSFKPSNSYYTRSDIVAVIEEACEIATSDSINSKQKIRIKPEFYLNEFGENLLVEIENKIKKSKICIIDISDNNPNVFFELGLAKAYGCQVILIKSKKSANDFKVPSDITGLHLLFYENIKEITGRLSQRLVEIIKNTSLIGEDLLELARKTWNFGHDRIPSVINLVTAPSETQSVFKSYDHPNHIYLDNLCDKDSLLEVSILLSKLYPRTELKFFSTDHFQTMFFEDDLILIGGTGTLDDSNNEVAKRFFENLKVDLIYEEDSLTYKDVKYNTDYKGKHLSKDYALFSRHINPFNHSKRVFFLQGIHTFGVLGAIKSFALNTNSIHNHRLLHDSTTGDDFRIIFPVDILQGRVMPSQIIQENIVN